MRSFAIALALIAAPMFTGFSQEPVDRKHFAITISQNASYRMSAENMAYELWVVHLKGKVEISLSRGDKRYWMLRADEADFHIDTGALEPRGNVSLLPQNE